MSLFSMSWFWINLISYFFSFFLFSAPPAYYAHLAAFRARYYIEGIDYSDSGSTSDGGGGRGATRERNREVRPLPTIKDNVKDVMFYVWLSALFLVHISSFCSVLVGRRNSFNYLHLKLNDLLISSLVEISVFGEGVVFWNALFCILYHIW